MFCLHFIDNSCHGVVRCEVRCFTGLAQFSSTFPWAISTYLLLEKPVASGVPVSGNKDAARTRQSDRFGVNCKNITEHLIKILLS